MIQGSNKTCNYLKLEEVFALICGIFTYTIQCKIPLLWIVFKKNWYVCFNLHLFLQVWSALCQLWKCFQYLSRGGNPSRGSPLHGGCLSGRSKPFQIVSRLGKKFTHGKGQAVYITSGRKHGKWSNITSSKKLKPGIYIRNHIKPLMQIINWKWI